ncbi:MAG: DUF4965 domain-containing protein [Bacteroidales bacterium]|nr:DUF4965 domain-containing protein [Bacteroidales bacterium]
MKRYLPIIALLLIFIPDIFSQVKELRAPSYPLITHDPYFSIWISDENPTEVDATHWTNKPMPVRSMVRIDGKVYRLMGKLPAYVPAALSTGATVTATQTTFSFTQDGIGIEMTFMSPLIVEDIDLVTRPVTYVTWEIRSEDGKPHKADLYFEISGLACVDNRSQQVVWDHRQAGGLEVLKIGTQSQEILKKSGDDVRIDWGYLYAAAPGTDIGSAYAGRGETASAAFTEGEKLPFTSTTETGGRVADLNPVLSFEIPADISVGEKKERHVLLAYDDIFSVEYFGRQLEGYWKKKFTGIDELLAVAEKEYNDLKARCNKYDNNMAVRAESAGGEKYASICILAHRQCMAAHKVVMDESGQPLCFSKENFSNGSMGTVDVFYPASPFFLYLNPELLKAQTTPIFDYAESGRWPWPYAPHDIGKYPLGNGQKYGGGELTEERQMPVEECGNMLILAYAIACTEGDAEYAGKYWQTITKWAEYLREKGFNPDNQLCTDDFAGHLAHNANLSVKAIMGIASYASLSDMLGHKEAAIEYRSEAEKMMKNWIREADDGDHYRLAFDKPGTWSQKYNMVWDEVLGFSLIPDDVISKEIKHYLKVQNRYGLPLDNRSTYTKIDWILWTASMAGTEEDFRQLVSPVYNFLDETPDRVPMTDWYWTTTGEMRGFVARSVVGGVYMELLKEKMKSKNQ